MRLLPQAIIFDLGGTLLECWDEQDARARWGCAYDYLITTLPGVCWPGREAYVRAMLEAEAAHWQKVVAEQWSGPPAGLLRAGLRRLGLRVGAEELLVALEGYARAARGWTVVYPDTRPTLQLLKERGYRIGVLSNTWWDRQWHDADLARHGLLDLCEERLYTSGLSHSKPHPSVFLDMARRLGVPPATCWMVGDRIIEDIEGALGAGMQAVWKRNDSPWPRPAHIVPSAQITQLAELPALLKAHADEQLCVDVSGNRLLKRRKAGHAYSS